MEVRLHSFLASLVNEGDRSASRSGRFILGNITQWIEGLMDSRADQDDLEKRIEISTLSLTNLSLVTVRTKLIRLSFKSFLYFPSLLDLSLQHLSQHRYAKCALVLSCFLSSYNTFFHSQALEITRHFKSGILYTTLPSSDKNHQYIF